jgi:putative membrane protein
MLVSWAANAVVLAIAGAILGGVTFHDSASALVVSAAIFGVLNTIFKPLIKLITLPLAVLTLGIAWFFVAMLMLWLTQLIVPKFDINGFSNYVWATIIVWAVNVVLDVVLRPRARAESPARA